MRAKQKSEFDAYSKTYDDAVNAAITFSGLSVDSFTKFKADYISEVISHRFPQAETSILDVGCGIGNSLALLVNSVGRGRSFRGVDISEVCIATAAERITDADFLAYDGCNLPYPDASIDVAFSICVFHHVAPNDRFPLARDIRRVLRPGGVFLIFEHNPRNPLTLRIVNKCEFDKNAVLLRVEETENLMREAGFLNISSRFILTVPPSGPVLRNIDRLFFRLPFGAQYCTSGDVL
jgi:ubiquinone/menaquinone biosynthesis C-methylase UbiE